MTNFEKILLTHDGLGVEEKTKVLREALRNSYNNGLKTASAVVGDKLFTEEHRTPMQMRDEILALQLIDRTKVTVPIPHKSGW